MTKFLLAGLQLIQRLMLGQQTGVLLKVKLWTNGMYISDSSTYADFDICTCPGYADQTLIPFDWTIDALDRGTGRAIYPTITFNFTGNPENEVIYGYILFEQMSSTGICVNTFDQPFTPIVDGDSLPINIVLYDSNVPDND
jgi:hypothetical protein